MKKHRSSPSQTLCCLLFLASAAAGIAEPTPAAASAFDSYVGALDSRLSGQHQSKAGFLGPAASSIQTTTRLRQGELIIENIAPANDGALPGALLHHWRGTAFVPEVTAADFEHLLKDLDQYPQYFSPQVLQAKALSGSSGHLQTSMRIRQKHGLTVVMDTTYDVTFGALDPQHRYSISRSTRISELGSQGTLEEHVLKAGDEHGFLWRQNTYWTYEEGDGGLYMQIESVSLTRSIPAGLGWLVRPFVESIPREALEFTLRSARAALLNKRIQPTKKTNHP